MACFLMAFVNVVCWARTIKVRPLKFLCCPPQEHHGTHVSGCIVYGSSTSSPILQPLVAGKWLLFPVCAVFSICTTAYFVICTVSNKLLFSIIASKSFAHCVLLLYWMETDLLLNFIKHVRLSLSLKKRLLLIAPYNVLSSLEVVFEAIPLQRKWVVFE